MYVLIALSKAVNKSYHACPTQIAALCVDESWELKEHFISFIKPKDKSYHNWKGEGYRGGLPEEFLSARSARAVFSDLDAWLFHDDVLCFWDGESLRLYENICEFVCGKRNERKTKLVADYIRSYTGVNTKSPYTAARELKVRTTTMCGNAKSDAVAMRQILQTAHIPHSIFAKSITKTKRGDCYGYDLNALLYHSLDCELIPDNAVIAAYQSIGVAVTNNYSVCSCVKDEFNMKKRQMRMDNARARQFVYLYSASSSVFHRMGCYKIADIHTANLRGNVTFSKNSARRPCKMCSPSPDDIYSDEFKSLPSVIAVMNAKKKKQNADNEATLSRETKNALKRLKKSKEERGSGILETPLTAMQRSDVYTLTQPSLAFFAAAGYSNFHLRSCSRLEKTSNIRGFSTYEKACRAGYTPCKHCRPTQKQNLDYSIPIDNQYREDETSQVLADFCKNQGYPYHIDDASFYLETGVGKWIIDTDTMPVKLMHINLVRAPSDSYHLQPRRFLSLYDAIRYIHRHDTELEKQRAERKIYYSLIPEYFSQLRNAN